MDYKQLALLDMIGGKGGSLGLTGMDNLAATPNVGIANSAGLINKVGMPDLSQGQDAMKMGMQAAAAPEEKPFDLKGLASDLNAILKSQQAKQADITSELDAAMTANQPQGVTRAAPQPTQAQQVGMAQAMPSPAMQAMGGGMQGASSAMSAIQGGQPQGVGIGAQPSVQEMMRRIYGR